MKNIASSTDTTPEHNLETSGWPFARRQAGALNMSELKNSLLRISLVFFMGMRSIGRFLWWNVVESNYI